MGMIDRMRRWTHVTTWRARYWWLDTPSGARAHVAMFCISVLVVFLQLLRMFTVQAPTAGQPVKAVWWWVVQIIIAIVAAAVAYSMRPKTQTPAPQSGDAPTVEDGQTVKHYFGTCWVEDQFLLAWKQMGTIPIKSKGGKK